MTSPKNLSPAAPSCGRISQAFAPAARAHPIQVDGERLPFYSTRPTLSLGANECCPLLHPFSMAFDTIAKIGLLFSRLPRARRGKPKSKASRQGRRWIGPRPPFNRAAHEVGRLERRRPQAHSVTFSFEMSGRWWRFCRRHHGGLPGVADAL
jgi:hypothetical protein